MSDESSHDLSYQKPDLSGQGADGPAQAPPVVFFRIGVPSPIEPCEPLPALPEIPRGALVVVEGRAPIWRYGMALHRLHGSPAAALAVFDPRLGAVVIASHSPRFHEGQVLDIPQP